MVRWPRGNFKGGLLIIEYIHNETNTNSLYATLVKWNMPPPPLWLPLTNRGWGDGSNALRETIFRANERISGFDTLGSVNWMLGPSWFSFFLFGKADKDVSISTVVLIEYWIPSRLTVLVDYNNWYFHPLLRYCFAISWLVGLHLKYVKVVNSSSSIPEEQGLTIYTVIESSTS